MLDLSTKNLTVRRGKLSVHTASEDPVLRGDFQYKRIEKTFEVESDGFDIAINYLYFEPRTITDNLNPTINARYRSTTQALILSFRLAFQTVACRSWHALRHFSILLIKFDIQIPPIAMSS